MKYAINRDQSIHLIHFRVKDLIFYFWLFLNLFACQKLIVVGDGDFNSEASTSFPDSIMESAEQAGMGTIQQDVPINSIEVMAGETNAGETNAGETNAGETNAGETNADETNAGETITGGSSTFITCEQAGGDICAPIGSPLCDALLLLESDDCPLCCAFPVDSEPYPQSFHTVTTEDRSTWDHLTGLPIRPLIASETRPYDIRLANNSEEMIEVPYEYWAQNLIYQDGQSGILLADQIDHLLTDPTEAPTYVLLHELNLISNEAITQIAQRMNQLYPQWRGRWGVYLGCADDLDYQSLESSITELLKAGAIIIPKILYSRVSYCASGSTVQARDAWLIEMIRGNTNYARIDWLRQRARELASSSKIRPVFGVADQILAMQSNVAQSPAAHYLDRLFYIWVHHTEHADLISPEQGGVGAWKWDSAEVTNTSRDLAFVQSFMHHLVNRIDSFRHGQNLNYCND